MAAQEFQYVVSATTEDHPGRLRLGAGCDAAVESSVTAPPRTATPITKPTVTTAPDAGVAELDAGERGYDIADFVADMRHLGAHIGHAGHQSASRIRIEEPFGWMETIAGGRILRYIGNQPTRAWFV